MIRSGIWVTMLIVLNLCTGIFASETINFQGVLKDPDGVPIASGTYDMRFTIYPDESTGTNVWQETHTGTGNRVSVTAGHYNVELGVIKPFPSGFFDKYKEAWLEVEVDLNNNKTYEAEEKFAPRTKLVPSPYSIFAYSADDSDALGGESPSFYRDASNINAGTLDINRFPLREITSTHIQFNGLDGAVLDPDVRAYITVGGGTFGADANAGADGNIHGNALYAWAANDDAACIQAALNYIDAIYGAGTVILLPDSFNVDAQISIPAGVRLVGAHPNGTPYGSTIMCEIADAGSCTILMNDNTALIGIYFDTPTSGNAAPIVKVPNGQFRIEECFFKVDDAVAAVAPADTSVGTISRPSSIVDCVFDYSVDTAEIAPIELSVPVHYVTVANNVFDTRGRGITFGSTSSAIGYYNKIVNNRFRNSSYLTEDQYAATLYCNYYALIEGNLVTSQRGFYVGYGSYHSRVHSNTIRCGMTATDIADYGIFIYNTSYVSTIGNHITDSEDYAIYYDNSSSGHGVIANNIMQGCNRGIHVEGASTIIQGNHISAFEQYALMGYQADYLTITGNHIIETVAGGDYGSCIWLDECDNSTFSGNVVVGYPPDGFNGIAIDASNYCCFVGNVIKTTSTAPSIEFDTCTYCLLEGNVIRNPVGACLGFPGSSNCRYDSDDTVCTY